MSVFCSVYTNSVRPLYLWNVSWRITLFPPQGPHCTIKLNHFHICGKDLIDWNSFLELLSISVVFRHHLHVYKVLWVCKIKIFKTFIFRNIVWNEILSHSVLKLWNPVFISNLGTWNTLSWRLGWMIMHSSCRFFKESRFSPSRLIRYLTPLVAIALKIPPDLNSAKLMIFFFNLTTPELLLNIITHLWSYKLQQVLLELITSLCCATMYVFLSCAWVWVKRIVVCFAVWQGLH